MSKWLIIDPQLKLVTVLHYAQGISTDVPREQKCWVVPIINLKIHPSYLES